MDETVPVKSTALSLELVEAVAASDGATANELSESFDIPQSTIHDHLTTLARTGYLRNEAGTYRVSTKFLGIAERARNNRLIYKMGKPEVRKLAEETDEHAGLMIREGSDGVFLYTARGSGAEPLSLDEYAGIRMPLYVAAPAKAILAHIPSDRIDDILAAGAEADALPGAATPSDVRAELEEVRARGYAVSRGERIDGMLAIAAPILDGDGTASGSLSIYGPMQRIENEEMIAEYSALVKKAANVAEVNLDHA